ncbi:MAG: C40 family peptidase [Polyangiales bacterium]
MSKSIIALAFVGVFFGACGSSAAGTTSSQGTAINPASDPSGNPAASPSGDNASPSGNATCSTLAADLSARDALPESTSSTASWYSSSMQGSWGPAAATLPAVATPTGCDRVTFARERVLAAAKHYTGLSYQHHHVPAWDPSSAWSGAEGPGLDCSNFTSWVYNYGLGIKFTSNVVDQAATAGRQLAPNEPLQPGDLLFITSADGSAIVHVVILVDADTVIDDTSSAPAVGLRPFAGWYKTRFSHARRVIE